MSFENLSALKEYLKDRPIILSILERIQAISGIAYLVGGAVRDLLLQENIKDIDIEVHNLSIDELKDLLSQFEHANLVGKSFGVLKLSNLDIDWSIPRIDFSGRKPEVILDPNLDIKQALKRRDLTINAMAINLHNFEFIDPFNGYVDLKAKILRATDKGFFKEDPLRFFRVMQFCARFQMTPDNSLDNICASMNIKDVSIERIALEFEKLFLKSKKPSLGFRWLKKIKRITDVLPELAATIGVEQNPEWHPEGDVFEHTMQAIDAAELLECDDVQQKLILLFAALCHDLGKAVSTAIIDGKIKSHGHDIAGVSIAKKMLKRVTKKNIILDIVPILVKYHMAPGIFIAQHAKPAAYRRLAVNLGDYANLKLLGMLALADRQGRNPHGHEPLKNVDIQIVEFIKKAREYNVLSSKPEPILKGADLLDIIIAGPKMGRALQSAYQFQLESGITDKKVLKEYILKNLKNFN